MLKNPIACLAVMMLFAAPCTVAQEQAEPVEETKPAQAIDSADPVAEAIKAINKQDNGITINAEDGHVDVAATVCLRSGDFLEMLACTEDTREHESILVINAAPSQMHLGLLLLGLEPGKPLSYDQAFDPPKLIHAKGPEVGVFIVVKLDETEREIPANRWVQDNKTKEIMKGNTWLFAGSQFTAFQDKPVYQADLNGSAISLVNFGDDLLTLPNKLTDANDHHDKVWAPRTQAIPKVGTKVTIRLRPMVKDKTKGKEDSKHEDQGNDKQASPPPSPAPNPNE